MGKTILIIFSLCLLFTLKSYSIDSNADGQNSFQMIYINSSDTIKGITKGQISLHLSLPYINNFHLNPVNEGTKNNTGFMGYSVGLDYYYKPNQFVNLSFSQIQDFFLPIAFVDRGDEYELMSSYVFNLTNNHKVKRFSLGYGIAFSKNSWELRNLSWDENSSTRKPVKKNNNALGLSFSSYYQLTQSFYVGFIYRPTFLRLNSDPTFKYEHTISIDIAWKIRLKK
jgi:hypothetical protein